MSHHRDEKVVSLLSRLAAEFVRDVVFPASLVTITNVDYLEKANSSTIYISVFPEEKEGVALDLARRRRSDLREYVREHAKMRAVPYFEFEIDRGEKNRQLIDELAHE